MFVHGFVLKATIPTEPFGNRGIEMTVLLADGDNVDYCLDEGLAILEGGIERWRHVYQSDQLYSAAPQVQIERLSDRAERQPPAPTPVQAQPPAGVVKVAAPATVPVWSAAHPTNRMEGITAKQEFYIYNILGKQRNLSPVELDDWVRALYNCEMSQLSKAETSQFIDILKDKGQHPPVPAQVPPSTVEQGVTDADEDQGAEEYALAHRAAGDKVKERLAEMGLTRPQAQAFVAAFVGGQPLPAGAAVRARGSYYLSDLEGVLDFLDNGSIRRGNDAGRADALDFIANPQQYLSATPMLPQQQPTHKPSLPPKVLPTEQAAWNNLGPSPATYRAKAPTSGPITVVHVSAPDTIID